MESAVAAIISVALVVFATLTVWQGAFVSTDRFFQSWRAMEERSGEMARTELNVSRAVTGSDPQNVNVTINNEGSVPLADFENWDVIVQYYDGAGDYYVVWAPYSSQSPPPDNQWTVRWIRTIETGDDETYEPGTLNPGEKMRIRFRASAAVGVGTTNMVTVAAPNGIATSATFTR